MSCRRGTVYIVFFPFPSKSLSLSDKCFCFYRVCTMVFACLTVLFMLGLINTNSSGWTTGVSSGSLIFNFPTLLFQRNEC